MKGVTIFLNTKYEAKIDMTNKSLSTCLKECLFYNIRVFGVQNTTCYCFLNNMFNSQELVDPTLCNISCDYNVIESCGGDSYLALYSVYSDDGIHWGKNEPSNKQCAYIKRKHPQPEAYTASCYSFSAGGYVCIGALLPRHCDRSFINFCIKIGTLTWQEAYKSCLNDNGMHSDWMRFINYGRGLKFNHNYWFGPYRTFRMSGSATINKTVCVAATRRNNTLYLEPDDCSEMKHSLCKPKILQHVGNKLKSEVDMTLTANQSDRFWRQRNEESTSTITEYVPHLLSGFALLLSVIVIIFMCRQQALFQREVVRLHSSETGNDYITLT